MKTELPLNPDTARSEVLSWLRKFAGNSSSLKDEDPSIARAGEIVTRFLSRAEPAGFRLNLLATGSLGDPRLVGSWRWHERVLPFRGTPDSHDRETARLMACATLLRDGRCRTQVLEPYQYAEAA